MMRGLFYKELIISKRVIVFIASVIAVIGLFPLISAFDNDMEMFPLYICFSMMSVYFVTGVYVDNIFSVDERRQWSIFVSSTPSTMKGQILCKYLLIFLIDFLVLFINHIADVVAMAVIGSFSVSTGTLCLFLFGVSVIVKAVIIPFDIRFGSDMGKNILCYFVILLLALVGIYFLFGDISYFLDGDIIANILKLLNSDTVTLIARLTPVVAILVYFISYIISTGIYRKGIEHYTA